MTQISSPLYVMKVGEATYCLKNHMVLGEVAKKLQHHLHAAGLSTDEEQYVREFATREQAAAFIQNSTAQKPVLVVIDDNSDVNCRAEADYPQPNLLYFTGTFITKEIVFGTGQKFKARCDEFAQRCLDRSHQPSTAPSHLNSAEKNNVSLVDAATVSKGTNIQPDNEDVIGQKDDLSENDQPFACATCLDGNSMCFCLVPVAELLMKHHSDCCDQELVQFVDKYLASVTRYQPTLKSKGDTIGENGESSRFQVVEKIDLVHLKAKEPVEEVIEKSRTPIDAEEFRLERRKLEESLIKTLDIKDSKKCDDLKIPNLDESEDEEIGFAKVSSSEGSSVASRSPTLAFETSDLNDQKSSAEKPSLHHRLETSSISPLNTPLLDDEASFFDEFPRPATLSFIGQSSKASSLKSQVASTSFLDNTTLLSELTPPMLLHPECLKEATLQSTRHTGKTIGRAIIRTPIMEQEAVDPMQYTSVEHQMPVPSLGTNYQDILMEIEHHNITMSQLRATFAANLSRAHEVISQQKLTDQLYRDLTTVNAAIENELKESEGHTNVERTILNCWVALIVYHSKLTNLLLMAAHSNMDLPTTNLTFLRAATKKLVGLNPGEKVKQLLGSSIALFRVAHETHDLAALIPTFFRDAHKIAVYITVIRLEQVLSRVHADVKGVDISVQDASRLVQNAWEVMKASEHNVAEKYAAFFNIVRHLLQERWELIGEPFPDFEFTSTIDL